MTENDSTLRVTLGCNPRVCEVYSSAVSVKENSFFFSDKRLFLREISLLLTYIFLHRSWKVQDFHLDNTCQNVILWDHCFLR